MRLVSHTRNKPCVGISISLQAVTAVQTCSACPPQHATICKGIWYTCSALQIQAHLLSQSVCYGLRNSTTATITVPPIAEYWCCCVTEFWIVWQAHTIVVLWRVQLGGGGLKQLLMAWLQHNVCLMTHIHKVVQCIPCLMSGYETETPLNLQIHESCWSEAGQ